ncbi:Bcr/CflA subfamily drug resistance transporter [Paraburkholderia bryophila]|uniref:Bcr/CflA family efflux transporter n=2 Tax=Paraburkholderia bryophila TaxID=420952 RepID=A0A7Y9WAE4_9BURK|nr:multidrug effflux MFS transporter [Paraburkholderia bryophila]NYH16373.1 Bcr/CflA subfamily drug resistance transporter [Paraburkholderia bryophila]
MTSPKLPPRFSTLVLLCALSVLPLSIFLPSLPKIATDLHADYALVGLSLAGYATVAAVLELIMGPLSDRFGRRPIMLASLTVFVIGSLGCALTANVRVFLAFRLLQAPITSCYPVSMAAIRDTTGKEGAASRIGYAAMAAALAPMLGPTVGGLLDQLCGWRAIFWSLALAGIALFAVCWFGLGETNRTPSDTIRKQLRAYPALFRERRFWAYALCMAFSTGAFYAFLSGAPLAAQAAFDVSPATLGFYMGTITAGFIVGSFLSGRYGRRYRLTTTMTAGRVVACMGPVIALVLYLVGVRHAVALFGPCMLVGVGNGLSNPCAHAGAVSVRPELAGSASGLAGAMTIAGGSALSSVTGAVLTENNAAYAPLCLMLLSSLIALLAALYVRVLDTHGAH